MDLLEAYTDLHDDGDGDDEEDKEIVKKEQKKSKEKEPLSDDDYSYDSDDSDDSDDEEDKESVKEEQIKPKEKKPLTDELDQFLRYKQFERALVNPNMRLIFKIIQGNYLEFLEGDHKFIEGEGDKTKAEVYMVLMGLQSIRKKTFKKQLSVKDCLAILSGRIESDISKLSEILTFLATKECKVNYLLIIN